MQQFQAPAFTLLLSMARKNRVWLGVGLHNLFLNK